MACPYFEPAGRLSDERWIRPPRMPLGAACAGVCRAPSAEEYRPDAATLYENCNLGYARGRCQHFPESSPADAIRFAASTVSEGLIRIRYIVEKDHAPVDHGIFEYSAGQLSGPESPVVLRSQARAFLESYLAERVRE